MATPRKAGAGKTKPAATLKKSAKVAKKPAVPVKAAKRPVPQAPVAKARPVAKPTKPTKAVAEKPARAGARPASASAAARAKSASAARRAAQAEVRPLGVLPASAMARSTPRAPVAQPAPRPVSPRHESAPRPTTGAEPLSETDMKEFEQRLLEERRKILKEMGHLENTVLKVNQRDSAGDLSGYSFHMADVGTDSMEREKAFLFASAEGRTLMEIDEALRRLYRGEYGTCESCGQQIARARLEAMPHARLCVSCKEKEERARRGAS
jgi:RNA polymerase-binding protein DksA